MNFSDIRIGHGYDVHKLVENRALILGGVNIPYEKGLLGHSDADVLVHAVMDSIIGAMGMGDIGKLFPDTDMKYKDISSMLLAEQVYSVMTDNGYSIVNIDATVIAQRPKLSPYIREMAEKIAKVFGTDASRVNIKATTEEKLGFTGRGEGISAHSVCIIIKK